MNIKTFRGFLQNPELQIEFEAKGWANRDSADYEGIVFSDGHVAVRWLTNYRSTTTWDSLDDFLACYGNGYRIEYR